MAYQRAQWHSGLTYQQTCETCKTVLQYTDYSLDFRPWYADGYVDCPKCKNHLRHNENFAINNPIPITPVAVPEQPVNAAPAETPLQEQPAYAVELEDQVPAAAPETPAQGPVFCTGCGHKFGENDRFCSQCGSKRG